MALEARVDAPAAPAPDAGRTGEAGEETPASVARGLKVASTPAGARVVLEGREVGTTPLTRSRWSVPDARSCAWRPRGTDAQERDDHAHPR